MYGFFSTARVSKKGEQMAKSSIHIEAGGGGYFAHNSRETPTVNSVFSDEQNFCSCSKEEAFKLYRSELQIRSEAYTERTGQKLQKNAITHLSAIVNFNKDHTPEDMQRVCELLERKLDTKVLQMAMHRDEGKSADDKNYHAHIEFIGLDSRGESVRRKLDRPTLRELQSEVSKTLGMERGHDYAKERLPRPKRLDTYEYKTHKEGIEKGVKEAVLATQKDLNAEMAVLRSQLKDQGATRADYAEVEKIKREFTEQIKAKELTIDQLTKQLETVRSLRSSDQTKILELSQTVEKMQTAYNDKEERFAELSKIKDIKIEALKTEVLEAKRPSAAQSVSVDIEQIEEVKKLKQITLAVPNTDERNALAQKLQKENAIDEIAKSCYKRVEEKGVFTTTTKTVFDHNGFIQKVKERENEHQKLHSFNDRIIVAVVDKMKTVVEMSKTALETIKSKFMSKSLPEVQKELVVPQRSKAPDIKEALEALEKMQKPKGFDISR